MVCRCGSRGHAVVTPFFIFSIQLYVARPLAYFIVRVVSAFVMLLRVLLSLVKHAWIRKHPCAAQPRLNVLCAHAHALVTGRWVACAKCT